MTTSGVTAGPHDPGPDSAGMRGSGPHQVVVVAGDGSAFTVGDQREAARPEDATAAAGDRREDGDQPITDLVEQPAKVMRIGSMIKQLLEEVKAAPLDEASRRRLREIHRSSITELKDGLAPELVEELDRLSLPFSADEIPTDPELRIAQAQLVGWLEGLFHGIQTALFAQQMAARAQLEQMRRALPAGPGGPSVPSGVPEPTRDGGGLYL